MTLTSPLVYQCLRLASHVIFHSAPGLGFIFKLHYFMCTCIKTRGQLVGASPLLPCGPQGSNSGSQTWLHMSLPAQASPPWCDPVSLVHPSASVSSLRPSAPAQLQSLNSLLSRPSILSARACPLPQSPELGSSQRAKLFYLLPQFTHTLLPACSHCLTKPLPVSSHHGDCLLCRSYSFLIFCPLLLFTLRIGEW